MTVILQLPPEREAAYRTQADARGLSVEQWLLEMADKSIPPAGAVARFQMDHPDDWLKAFDAWVDSHDPATPVLSDDAMERENIYPD